MIKKSRPKIGAAKIKHEEKRYLFFAGKAERHLKFLLPLFSLPCWWG